MYEIRRDNLEGLAGFCQGLWFKILAARGSVESNPDRA
jgi:hypothetical protein